MAQLYVALLRGINVGGNNIIRMSDLKRCFESAGFEKVATYIQSGNVVFSAGGRNVREIAAQVESLLSKQFRCGSKVVIVSQPQLKQIVDHAPPGFGQHPDRFRYDVIFVRPPLRPGDVIAQVPLKEGVDRAVPGKYVLYFSRLVAKASQSRLSKIVALPVYKELTIRNWNTTTRLLALMQQ